MDDPLENLSHMSCLLCGGWFLHPGPRYPVYLYTCHGVVEDSHRAYLVRVTEYKMKHGELPVVDPEEETTYDCFIHGNVDEREDQKSFHFPAKARNQLTSWMNPDPRIRNAFRSSDRDHGGIAEREDTSSVRRVRLTMMNPYPRINRAPSTPRRKWDGEDDKTRDPDFSLRKRSRSSSTRSTNVSLDNITQGKRSRSSRTKSTNVSLDSNLVKQKLPCETCDGYYASMQSLYKHQRKVCKKNPKYQGHPNMTIG